MERQDDELPIVGTIAAQFNDVGVNELFEKLFSAIEKKCNVSFTHIADAQNKKANQLLRNRRSSHPNVSAIYPRF